jgi:hypothetical protein
MIANENGYQEYLCPRSILNDPGVLGFDKTITLISPSWMPSGLGLF